jgi:hypothetical protein
MVNKMENITKYPEIKLANFSEIEHINHEMTCRIETKHQVDAYSAFMKTSAKAPYCQLQFIVLRETEKAFLVIDIAQKPVNENRYLLRSKINYTENEGWRNVFSQNSYWIPKSWIKNMKEDKFSFWEINGKLTRFE